MLRDVLSGLTRATSPFADDVPRLDALGTTWVEPVLVVDVESLGPSAQGRLRQPSYVGVPYRPDPGGPLVKTLVASVAIAAALTLLTPGDARAGVTHVTLGGVRVALHADTRQVVTVNRTRGLPRARRLLGAAPGNLGPRGRRTRRPDRVRRAGAAAASRPRAAAPPRSAP